MKMKTIRVKILSDGVTAKEVNPLPEPNKIHGSVDTAKHYASMDRYERWKEAESKLRTFEIEYGVKKFKTEEHRISLEIWKPKPNSIYEAELLPNGKIKIFD